jgi:hypothetical protein
MIVPDLNLADIGLDAEVDMGTPDEIENINVMEIMQHDLVSLELASFDQEASKSSESSVPQEQELLEVVLVFQAPPVKFLHLELQPEDLNVNLEQDQDVQMDPLLH